MKKILFKSTALSLSLFCSAFTFAEGLTPKQSLDRMSHSSENLNYDIAFVQTTPDSTASYRYRHIKDDHKTYAQLTTLDGRYVEILQRDNLVSYLTQDAAAFTIRSSEIVDTLPAIMRANFDRLANHYDFIYLGKDRVAGRLAATIRIKPKDDLRYQYIVAVDEDNGLLLRSDMLDLEDNLLDEFRVVTLSIDHRLKGLADYLNKMPLPLLKYDDSSTPYAFNWSANWLPAGFEVVRHKKEVFDGEEVESILYSDGLFDFTVFVTNSDGTGSPSENPFKVGSTVFYSELVGDKEVSFIGQLPLASAQKIIQGVRFKE